MKLFKKISIFASSSLVLSLIFSVCVFAAEITKDTKPEDFSDRLELALQGTVTGILMVFSVLTLLTLILYLSKIFFYDIPEKRRAKERAKNEERFEPEAPASAPAIEEPVVSDADNAELAAVITAAIAAMLDNEEYKEEFRGGFRVVSFKRSDNSGAWNKK